MKPFDFFIYSIRSGLFLWVLSYIGLSEPKHLRRNKISKQKTLAATEKRYIRHGKCKRYFFLKSKKKKKKNRKKMK